MRQIVVPARNVSQLCASSTGTLLHLSAGAQIAYTYDVYWEKSDVTWDRRWDSYARLPAAWVRDHPALAFTVAKHEVPCARRSAFVSM
jgi:hypothetical protein